MNWERKRKIGDGRKAEHAPNGGEKRGLPVWFGACVFTVSDCAESLPDGKNALPEI